MRNLVRFIIQHHFLIFFLLIEFFSLFLLFSGNPYQKVAFYNASHKLSGKYSVRMSNIRDYFSLHYENRALAEENARLYNNLKSSFKVTAAYDDSADRDTAYIRKFRYLTTRVINNTINNQYNYITLDKGSKSGLRPEMAVIATDGIVGIVKSVSEDYASVLSVLNRDFNVSAKIKKSGYFGPLNWNGSSSYYATLVDIPHHVKIGEGDTIVTSGYGGVFPEGYMIGTISSFRLKGGNYYEIKVKLSTEFRKLDYVQVIMNYAKTQIDSLENKARQ
jgi:rod shape-determining protein MreC